MTDNNGGLGASSVEIVVKDELTTIDPIDAYIQNLPDDAFSKKANLKRKFFSYKLKLVSRFIERGRLHFATLILRYTVRAKMDGTVDGKSKNDWIIDPVAQQDLCNMIDALIGYLEKLLNPPLTKQPSMGTEIMMESPTEFVLSQNYPNPFNPRTTIHFQIPEAAYVKLKIYNAAGQEIRSLLDGAYKAGYHSITWDSKDNLGQFVSSGLYIYKMKAGEFIDVKKMQILK